MLSYEGVQDVLTAVVVVVAVAVVVAAAWISTSVREQPLVATAVVVFHSGTTVESSGGGSGGGDVNMAETPGGGSGGGGGEAVATPAEKNSEATSCPGEGGMEVKEVPQEASPNRTQESGMNISATEAAGDASDCSPDGAVAEGWSEEVQCISSSPEVTPSDALRPPPSDRAREEVPEMEVRRRRLQHFVSMGGSASTTIKDVSGLVAAKGEDVTSKDTATEEDRLTTPSAIPSNDTKHQQKEGSEVEEKEEEVKDSEEGREETRPPGSIRIRLKFLDETQRHVFAQLTEKVGSFKRQHFSIELDANRHIRLIFNGQLLSQDSSTLAQYGLFDNCVVHCHVSQPQLLPRSAGRSGEAAAQEEEDAYVSRLLAPLLYAVMVLMWYLRYEYGHLFNTMSTIILLFLTALLLISTYLLYITHHVPEDSATATHIPVARRTLTHTASSSAAASSSSPSASS